MTKANPIRLSIILVAFIFSIIMLYPTRSVELSIDSSVPVADITVDKKSNFKSSTFKVVCLSSGNIGEKQGLKAEIRDDQNKILKKDINIGEGYTVGSKLNFGEELPSFSFSAGTVQKDVVYKIDFNVEYMNLGLDLVGGSELVYEIPSGSGNTKAHLDTVIKIVGKKLNGNGMKEIYIQRVGTNRLLIQLPGLKKSEVEKIKRDIETQGQLEISAVVKDETVLAKARKYVERGLEKGLDKEKILPLPNFKYKFVYKHVPNAQGIMVIEEGSEVLVEVKTEEEGAISGKHIERATRGRDNQSLKGGYSVNIKFGPLGSKRFGQLTRDNVNNQLAIILDGDLVSYPNVEEPILTGDCRITGGFTQEEADSLVTVLNSGSMDVKLELFTENTVGPTLGADSINSGIVATSVGACAVLVFMLFYYRVLGVIACTALILNMLMLFACMVFGEATLTLPGIAGFALTIGMAVDATVLIFERLREESLNEKQNIKASLTKGYERAFITIFDSNFTTFITALILYLVGNSAPVKGFCLSLMLGLMINLFAAVFVTQTLLAWAVANQKIKSFNMMGNISIKSIDFFALGKKVRVVSYFILIMGCVNIVISDKNILDVDFTGGNLLHVTLTEQTSTKEVRDVCEKAGFPRAVVQQFGDQKGLYYTIRTRHLNNEEKAAFQNFLQDKKNGLTVPDDVDEAFPTEYNVGGVAAKEMLAYSFIALLAAMLVILLYIMMRFSEFKYGFGACIALFHDIGITVSMIIVLGFQINLTIFAAILTVIGYSLNDTIVIFDRIRENIGAQKNFDFKSLAIKSLNQTLKRTVLTSITTLFVILGLLFSGGGVIKGFATTMLIGLISGTYSSLFIATPYVLHLYEKQKKLGITSTPEKTEPKPPPGTPVV